MDGRPQLDGSPEDHQLRDEHALFIKHRKAFEALNLEFAQSEFCFLKAETKKQALELHLTLALRVFNIDFCGV